MRRTRASWSVEGGLCTWAVCAALACLGGPAAAQQPEGEAPASDTENPADTDVVTPPELITYVEAPYPPEALRQGWEAAVVARITVGADGLVKDVEVVEPAGHGFDEAAVDAMRRFVFAPATRNGEPIESVVMYRYTFFLREADTETDAEAADGAQAAAPATLVGAVTDLDDTPIPEAVVHIAPAKDSEGEETTLRTDADGRFTAADLPAGAWEIRIEAPAWMELVQTETLVSGERREVTYRLAPETTAFETVVRGRKPPREVTRREITRREITRIPGTGGDALRSVQNLPGMARAPGISGQLIVRGSAPEDTRVFFDQMPIPLIYHFGGLTSVINSDLLDHIDYYPGNYQVAYGGATGGIIDVYPKQPADQGWHAVLDADLWDASALLEVPLSDSWSIGVSGRRSYVDALLRAVLPRDAGFEFTVAPRYYDYQLVADYHPASNKDTLRLFLLGSDDKVVFLFGDQVAGNPSFSGGIDFRTYFHQLQARWHHRFGGGVTNTLNLGVGWWGSDTNLGDNFRFNSRSLPLFFRDELAIEVAEPLTVRLGVDTQTYWSRWEVAAPAQLPTEGTPPDPLTDEDPVTTVGRGWYTWPAAYVEAEWRPLTGMRVLPGVRVAWFDQVRRFAVDPRLALRHRLFPRTTVKGGVGLFSQAPNAAMADAQFGNPDLQLIKALHTSIGVEQDITDTLNLSIEGFYKPIWDLVVPAQPSTTGLVATQASTGPRYVNDGTGTVYGFELLLKQQPTDRQFGWVSYTFMKSSRIDHPGEDPRPFDYDQTHILTVVWNVVLGRGWEAGLRYRLVTGNPNTPVVGSFYYADADTYWPVYGPTNSERMPPFHQLDLRVDKAWRFKHVRYAVYVDVQNVYNRKNPEGYQYNYDYSQRVYLTGLPVFPSIGMKIEY